MTNDIEHALESAFGAAIDMLANVIGEDTPDSDVAPKLRRVSYDLQDKLDLEFDDPRLKLLEALADYWDYDAHGA